MATVSDFIDEWRSASPWVKARTSGSTGIPKEILLSKADMLVSAKATCRFFGIDGNSVLACPLSPDYIAGKMMVVRAEVAGCRLIELPVSNVIELPCKVDFMPVVPSQVDSLLGAADKIGALLVGGAPLSVEKERLLVRSGINAYIGYGMTETCSHVALRRLDCSDNPFVAMPGISFEQDCRGCLVINAPEYSFGRLVTNDVVELVSPEMFRWKGRADNVINSGGIKIFPEEIERLISAEFPALDAFYVTSERDEKWGERAVLVVEGKADAGIVERMRSLLGKRAPKRVVEVSVLPRTATGKIKRSKML